VVWCVKPVLTISPWVSQQAISNLHAYLERIATTALEQSGGDALLGPGEIAATTSNDHDSAIGQHRRRQ
jgi:hypothetical protein